MAITYKRTFAEQFNKLSSKQKKFIKVLSALGDGKDITTLDSSQVLIEIKKEDATINQQELIDLINSFKCIH